MAESGVIGSVKEFDHTKNDFGFFSERLNQFFIANSITDSNKKRATLLSLLCEETFMLLRDLCKPIQPANKSFEELLAALKNHLDPSFTFYEERYNFYTAKQDSEESVSDWAQRVEKLASACGFHEDVLPSLITDIFVVGMGADCIRSKLFEENTSEATLTKLLQISLHLEETEVVKVKEAEARAAAEKKQKEAEKKKKLDEEGLRGDESQFEIACLRAHNELRAQHGVGPLKISRNLCNISQEWANNLAPRGSIFHRSNLQTLKCGENIYMSCGSNASDVASGRDAVKSWYDEIQLHSFGTECFSTRTGHFTQVIWKSSTELGVAIARSGSNIVVVANYTPPGNYQGQFSANVPRKCR